MVESFIGSLKTEWTDHHQLANVDAARRSVMRYVHFYDHHRLHQTRGYFAPDQYEQHHHEQHQ